MTFTNEFKTLWPRRGVFEIEPLMGLAQGMGVICGGFARWVLSPNPDPAPTDDIDIYCHDEESYTALQQEMRKAGFSWGRGNSFAQNMTAPSEGIYANTPKKIQLIKPQIRGRVVAMGTVEDILRNFDFTVIRAALVYDADWDIVGLVDPQFEQDEHASRLRLKNIHCPISSMLRCMKYAKRGYWMKSLDVLPLFLDWENRDAEYRDYIVENLTKLARSEGTTERGLNADEVSALYELMSID